MSVKCQIQVGWRVENFMNAVFLFHNETPILAAPYFLGITVCGTKFLCVEIVAPDIYLKLRGRTLGAKIFIVLKAVICYDIIICIHTPTFYGQSAGRIRVCFCRMICRQ